MTKEYNTAFFSLYERLFITLKNEFGEKKALDIFRKLMEEGLGKAYGKDFCKGSLDDFIELLSLRDESVGLIVEFVKKGDNEVFYRFLTNPFPNLNGHIAHDLLDDTYIRFKVNYLLGPEWDYKCTKHFWDGDKYTEFRIFKK